MFTKDDLGRIISERFTLRAGERIPKYLGKWMVDYVFEAIKIALIEDGYVNIKNQATIKRIDVPEHEKRMPNGDVIIIPTRAKLNVEWKPRFMEDLNIGEIKEIISDDD